MRGSADAAATSAAAASQSVLVSARESIMYACKIKETANGSRSCACREARQAFQVVACGRIAPNGEVDEYKRATKDGKNKAQGETHTQTQEKVELVFRRLDTCTTKDSHSSRGICRRKRNIGGDEGFHSPALSPCIAAIASLSGARLTLLVPVKG
jgi:hypothetical protein